MSKNSWRIRIGYLLKGLLLAPWLIKTISIRSTKDQVAAARSQAGDDIYPLF